MSYNGLDSDEERKWQAHVLNSQMLFPSASQRGPRSWAQQSSSLHSLEDNKKVSYIQLFAWGQPRSLFQPSNLYTVTRECTYLACKLGTLQPTIVLCILKFRDKDMTFEVQQAAMVRQSISMLLVNTYPHPRTETKAWSYSYCGQI